MRRRIEVVGTIDASTKVFGLTNKAFSCILKAEFDKQFRQIRAHELMLVSASATGHAKLTEYRWRFCQQYTVEYVVLLLAPPAVLKGSAILGLPNRVLSGENGLKQLRGIEDYGNTNAEELPS